MILPNFDSQSTFDSQQFEPYFQSIVCASTLDVVNVEALSRFVNSSGEVISPSDYIPILEKRIDFIKNHDESLWKKAIGKLVKSGWFNEGRTLSINVSPRWVTGEESLDGLLAIVEAFSVRPGSIAIEVTESDRVHGSKALMRFVARARMCGFDVLLDDYGVGSSNLQSVDKLPITGIKVDRSLIFGVYSDKRKRDILESSIGMARLLGLTCTAEGVETVDDFHVIRNIGFDCMQGFLFSRPLPEPQKELWSRI